MCISDNHTYYICVYRKVLIHMRITIDVCMHPDGLIHTWLRRVGATLATSILQFPLGAHNLIKVPRFQLGDSCGRRAAF